MKNCESCSKPIPPERLEALPDTSLCVRCTMERGDVPMKMGKLVFAHKTAGEIEILTPDEFERVNDLDPRGYYKNPRTTHERGDE